MRVGDEGGVALVVVETARDGVCEQALAVERGLSFYWRSPRKSWARAAFAYAERLA